MFDNKIILLTKANKIIKRAYSLKRNLTKNEIISKVKNLLKKWDDNCFLINMDWMFEMERENWELIVK